MINSVLNMMRCAEFDATEEIDRSNNPAMWPVGSKELQYHRASIFIGAIILTSGVVILIVGIYVGICTRSARSLCGALKELRMPSMFLVVIMIASQVCQVTISTMLLYERTEMSKNAVAADYMMTSVVAGIIWSYMMYMAYVCSFGMKVDIVELPPEEDEKGNSSHHRDDDDQQHTSGLLIVEEPTQLLGGPNNAPSSSGDDSDDDDALRRKRERRRRNRQQPRRSIAFRLWVFLMEPTHGPQAIPLPNDGVDPSDSDEEMVHVGSDVSTRETQRRNKQAAHLFAAEEWLCGNYYFVADRRWVAFGAIEVIAGALIDFSDGVPVTSASLTWCLFPLGVTGVLLAILLFLLLWKRPIAVRLSQWNTTIVVALLLSATAMCAGNVVLAKPDLEEAIVDVLVVVSLVCGVMSSLDIVMWLLLLVPGLRHTLGLRDTSLGSLLRDMRHHARDEEATRREEFGRLHGRGNDPALPYLAAASTDDTADPDAAAWHAMAVKVLAHRLRKSYKETQQRDQVAPISL
jgi:hypothetical protein